MPNQPTVKPLAREQILSVMGEVRDGKYICLQCRERCLSVFAKEGVTYVKCWHGCDSKDVFKLIRQDLGLWHDGAPAPDDPKTPKPSDVPDYPGFTLADYCTMKQLSLGVLREWFDVTEVELGNGKPAVAFPYKNANGKVLGTKIRRSTDSHDTYFKGKDPHVPYGLWLNTNRGLKVNAVNEWDESASASWPRDVVLCEGESDTQTLFAHGIPALGISGSNGWRPDFAELDVLKNAERIFIVQEPDAAGQKFVESIAKSFEGRDVFAIKFTEVLKDPSAMHLEVFGAPEAFDTAFDALVAVRPSAVKSWELQIVGADQIEPEIYKWLWQDRIPLNTFTLFCGLPDQGKSTVAIDITARVSSGTRFPDKDHDVEPGTVLMLIAEDDLANTVIPRLMAAKANMANVKFVTGTVRQLLDTATKEERRLRLDEDIRTVEGTLATMPGVRMLVIDPISSYLGDLNQNKSAEMRPLLENIKDMAKRAGITVIGIAHFNKNADQESIHRVAGAGSWGEVPRAIWGFVPKPVEEGTAQTGEPLSLMLAAKLNTASKMGRQGLKYRIIGAEIPTKEGPTKTSCIEWLGIATEEFREVMAPGKSPRGPKPAQREAAKTWLKAYLADGPRPSRQLQHDSKGADIKWDTLSDAKKELGVTSVMMSGVWYMRLPGKDAISAVDDGELYV
jgi:putative DNA primase/helicase